MIDIDLPSEDDDQDDDARVIWEYDPRLGEPYLEPMRAMIHREEIETP